MKITIVGAGNVGTVLGRVLKEKGHSINEVFSRKHFHAITLADELQARVCHDLKQINTESDLYIVAISDDAVGTISASLQLEKQIILHTSGSIPIQYLKNVSENYGVLYPLQSLRKETHDIPSMPFLVDGNNKDTLQQITNLAISISPQVIVANDETRFHYHLTAVIVSNFTNHLYALGKQYADQNEIDFKLLMPLIEEIVRRLYHYEPAKMQTGPAVRGDKNTIDKHLALLEQFPQLRDVYAVMSESISGFRN
ncbi:MAG TPA: DUF2520 domain-containing protein [Parafilimonas sp.]|nr:DUF2520 domain-containing protein [Parafilimonas sp.]